MRASIERRLNEIRNDPLRGLNNTAGLNECMADVMDGKVYKLGDIAKLWKCSHEFVRRKFVREPGVLHSGGMYLVPRCVLERVITRSMNR